MLGPGDHGSTFAGGPLIATAALAVLELIDDPAPLRNVRDLGTELRERLLDLDGVAEVRGRGLMIGIGLAPRLDAAEIAAAALRAGLVINVPEPGTLRLLPPLVIGRQEIGQAVDLIRESISHAACSAHNVE